MTTGDARKKEWKGLALASCVNNQPNDSTKPILVLDGFLTTPRTFLDYFLKGQPIYGPKGNFNSCWNITEG